MKGEGEKTCFQNMHIVKCGGVFGAGEGAGLPGRNSSDLAGYLGGASQLDDMGLVGPLAPDTISPVFTLWCTLVFMYIGALTLALHRAATTRQCPKDTAMPMSYMGAGTRPHTMPFSSPCNKHCTSH